MASNIGRTKKYMNEFHSRILACLVVNGGAVTSPGGMAIQRLTKLTFGGYTRIQMARAVRVLEEKGLVLRDNRPISGNQQARTTIPGRKPIVPKSCFGIHLAVEKDALPEEVTGYYVEELKREIERKMAKPKPEFRPVKARVARESDGPTKVETVLVGPRTVHEVHTSAEEIADALLAKVIERAKGVDSPDLLLTIQQLQKDNVALKTEYTEYARQVSVLRESVSIRDRNIREMTKRINLLADENEKLKKYARSNQERGSHLVASIADILGPDNPLTKGT